MQGDFFRGLSQLGKHPAPTSYGQPIFDLDEVDGARGRGVVLYKDALVRAEEVGRAINKQCIERGYVTRDGYRDVTKDIRGQTGECGWYVASGFLWKGSLDYDPHAGDCGKTEVKSVWSLSIGQGMGAWAYMPLMENDLRLKPDAPHIVAAPLRRNLKVWWFYGWYTPREAAKHDEWWHQFQFGKGHDGKGKGGWRVPVSAMYELELLKER